MKQISRLVLFFLICASAVTSHKQQEYRNEKVERELKELVRQWDTASVNHDVATLSTLLADEFTLSGMPKEKYLAFIKSPETRIESEVSDNFDIRVYKDVAVLIARDTIRLQRNGVSVVEVYRYIDVWMKRGGRWQCVATESYEIKKP